MLASRVIAPLLLVVGGGIVCLRYAAHGWLRLDDYGKW